MYRVSYRAIVREMRLFGGSLTRPSPQTDRRKTLGTRPADVPLTAPMASNPIAADR